MKCVNMFRRASGLIALLAVVCVAPAVKAAATNHGDYVGTNVMYLDVTENPKIKIPGPLPANLFGPPILSGGDALVFFTNNYPFEATSSNGAPALTDGALSVIVMAQPGQFLTGLEFMESGGFYFVGGTPGGTQASSTILSPKMTVLEATAGVNSMVNGTVTYGPNPTGTYASSGGAFTSGDWEASASFDFTGLVGVTKVLLTLDNVLSAVSENGSIAFIDKKTFLIDPTLTPVPEPGTIILGLIGGVGMVLVGRKSWKKKQLA